MLYAAAEGCQSQVVPSKAAEAYELEYNLWKEYNDTADEVLGKGAIATFNFLKTYTDIQTKSVAEYSDKLNMLQGVNVMSKFELLTLEKKLF